MVAAAIVRMDVHRHAPMVGLTCAATGKHKPWMLLPLDSVLAVSSQCLPVRPSHTDSRNALAVELVGL